MADSKPPSSGGRPHMEDLSDSIYRKWEATAVARIRMKAETLVSIVSGQISGGDVLSAASLGGVLGAKQCSTIVPVRHPQTITHARVEFGIDSLRSAIDITARVKSSGVSTIATEALCAAFSAALTIFDMCRSLDNEIAIEYVRLFEVKSSEAAAAAAEQIELDSAYAAAPAAPHLRVVSAGELPLERPGLKSKAKRKAKPKAKRKGKPKAKARAKSKPKGKTRLKAKPKAKARTKSKPKMKTRAKAKAKPKLAGKGRRKAKRSLKR